MKRLCQITSISLSLCLAAPHGAYGDGNAMSLMTAQPLPISDRIVQKARVLRASGALASRRIAPYFKATSAVANEVTQFTALLIITSALAYQVAREHQNLVKLGGAQDAPPQDQDLPICDPANSASVWRIVCSGELYAGMIGTLGFMTATLPFTLVSALWRNPAGRAGLNTFIGTMIKQAGMLGAGIAPGFLWSESVKHLPSPSLINQADGIAGRAAQALITKRWGEFQASTDGAIFNAILVGMYKVMTHDESLRNQWLYNTWRFGLARGEFFSAMAALVTAAQSQEVVAAVARELMAKRAWNGIAARVTSAMTGYIVSLGIGFGALTLLFETYSPQMLTKMIQSLRGFFNVNSLAKGRDELRILAYSFTDARQPLNYSDDIIDMYSKRFSQRMQMNEQRREDLLNVGVEKLYEIAVEQRALNMKIQIARSAVLKADQNQRLYVDAEGKILSLQEAWKLNCRAQANCSFPVIEQLKFLDRVSNDVREADQQIAELAEQLVDIYEQDIQLYENLVSRPGFSFPLNLVKIFSESRLRSYALRDSLLLTTTGLNSAIEDRLCPYGKSTRNRDKIEESSREELSIYYQQWYNEDEVFKSLNESLKDSDLANRIDVNYLCRVNKGAMK